MPVWSPDAKGESFGRTPTFVKAANQRRSCLIVDASLAILDTKVHLQSASFTATVGALK